MICDTGMEIMYVCKHSEHVPNISSIVYNRPNTLMYDDHSENMTNSDECRFNKINDR